MSDRIKLIRYRFYKNIDPFQYPSNYELKDWYNKAIVNNLKVSRDYLNNSYILNALLIRDPIFAHYTETPNNKRKSHEYNLKKSNYRPTKGAENVTYYKHPALNNGLREYAGYGSVNLFIDDGLSLSENKNDTSFAFSDAFGEHTVGKGYDSKGSYISYYDKWDLTPLKLYEASGLLHPVHFYDRFYLDDVMQLNRDAVKGTHWLPNVTVIGKTKKHMKGGIMLYFKDGKKIHIKESLKGSFIRYCGGNVTSECIARGKASPDPRIRKKATFADNARKWKHQLGGMLHKPEVEDESTEYGPEYWANIKIDPDSLNPYGTYKFGLPSYNDKWYVGDKAGDSLLTFVNNLYNELQSNIRTAYPEYSSSLIDNLADFMVRHYIKENGWRKVNKLVGGYGKATSTQQWINGMKKMYPNAMKANTFELYVNGLKANIQGNKYNSVNSNYFNELLNLFGGDKVRIGRYLKLIRDTK